MKIYRTLFSKFSDMLYESKVVNGSSDYVKFIIVGRGRSGTNVLHDSLNERTDVRMYSEVFNPAKKNPLLRYGNISKLPKSMSSHSIYVDPDEFEAFIKETNQYEQYISDVFSNTKLYQLTYETLADSFSPCMSNVQNIIGLDSIELRSRTKKQSDNNLSNYIDNYDDLKFHFRNTEHICFFD